MPRINIIDTLVGNGHPSDVDLVLVDGKIMLKDGKAVAVDEKEVLLKAEQEALETAERAEHPSHPFAMAEKAFSGDRQKFILMKNVLTWKKTEKTADIIK